MKGAKEGGGGEAGKGGWMEGGGTCWTGCCCGWNPRWATMNCEGAGNELFTLACSPGTKVVLGSGFLVPGNQLCLNSFSFTEMSGGTIW